MNPDLQTKSQVPLLQNGLALATAVVQSLLAQHCVERMQPPLQARKPALQAIPQVPPLQTALALATAVAQSAAMQQLPLGMQLFRHAFCPALQVQVPPGAGHVEPGVVQSWDVQQVPPGMQALMQRKKPL
jgi:hypothetical protein